jgi:hypothetical protein
MGRLRLPPYFLGRNYRSALAISASDPLASPLLKVTPNSGLGHSFSIKGSSMAGNAFRAKRQVSQEAHA